jgi:hypothetical protein
MLDRLLAQIEGIPDLLVAAALNENRKDLPLTRREVWKLAGSSRFDRSDRTRAHQKFCSKARRDEALALFQHRDGLD